MERKKVAVLFGGCSTEYEVSLQSAYSVITNMDPDKYEAVLIGITKDGRWYRYYGETENISKNTWHQDRKNCMPVMVSPDRKARKLIELLDGCVTETGIDIAFPVLHGKNGEDGTVQGLFELAGIPLVGCGTLSSALCMDKDRAHKLVAAAGIKVPPAAGLDQLLPERDILKQTECLSYPMFVKPVKSGSSYGVTKVTGKKDLYGAVKNAFVYDDQVIIEEGIDGFEVGCAVLGNNTLIIGEVDEIELSGGFFDYTEKYTLTSAKIHMPARIDADTSARIKDTAAVIYRVLGCRGFARVDMFLSPDRDIVFNEVNTIPGFTTHSRFPNMMKGVGLRYAEIVDRLIQLGLEE
jgi:D-alanine---D-serine ligase